MRVGCLLGWWIGCLVAVGVLLMVGCCLVGSMIGQLVGVCVGVWLLVGSFVEVRALCVRLLVGSMLCGSCLVFWLVCVRVSTCCVVGCFVDCSTGCLGGCCVAVGTWWLNCCLPCALVDWLFGCLVGWCVVCLVESLVGSSGGG